MAMTQSTEQRAERNGTPGIGFSTRSGRNRENKRTYQREWRAARRAAFFADKTCVDCGSTEQLELDHLDPAEKTSHKIWSWSEPRRLAEIASAWCVAGRAIRARHAAEMRIEHSTGGYKRGCRCEVCCAAKRAANERYAQRRGRELHPGGRLCRPLPSYSATAPRIPTYQLAEVISMPHLLIAHRTRDDQTEAEPVLVETADSRILTFQLDDGERLEFDRAELAAALADLEPA